ncbi:M23 family metallopeptidase [Thiomicrospira pelophila]|uniref:M23 family metallopeptidase n=1 Tax=Thiomicrospira pelophila TaxID=934 RepID=UPI0004A6AD17|nr:M23 family metallopeptidase [Thiomicrospira pelophila]
MSSRQHFTITITDVHGARHYSFSQFIKKFVWVLLIVFFLVVTGGAGSIWWLNKEVEEIQTLKRQAEMSFLRALDERQNEYSNLVEEKAQLINELEEKIKQVGFLDQTLQGLEELIGVQPEMDSPIIERVKITQLTTLEKQIMLDHIPNGRPVGVFRGVTSGYGWRTHPVRGTREFHYGIDYRGERGAPVLATADAVVEYSGYHRSSGYGNLIILSHAYGFKTFYGHLNSLNVKTGQFINKGDLIGAIGSTGVSTGPHLHYEVNFVQRKLNPAPFVQWGLEDYDSIFDKVEGIPWGSLSQAIRNQVEKVEKQLLLRDVQ